MKSERDTQAPRACRAELAPQIGSSGWREAIFEQGPARDPTGRSRPTQRFHLARVGATSDGQSIAEGGAASVAHLVLETMRLAGIVKRFKAEPFKLTKIEHGIDAIPDILVELCDGRLFVIEAKSSRFLTHERMSKASAMEVFFRQYDLCYLLWTDRYPLTPNVTNLMRELKRSANIVHDDRILHGISETLANGPQTILQLRQRGIYRTQLLAAIWNGIAHADINAPFIDSTSVHTDPTRRNFDRWLASRPSGHLWWANAGQAPVTLNRHTETGGNK